ncbi:MAG: tetratricopeptide repeat protein [Woeseiaceae bacterium]|nr:tetratricopeptide repeat protein [Woeseiaceae bacterium]
MSTNLSRLWLAGFVLVVASLFGRADAGDRSADEYIEMAREGMQVGEYLAAATNFRKAAEASDSVDIAQQATRIAFGFGFDDEARKAAERWLKLDRDSEQALLYVARLQLRDGRDRAARRNFKRLLKLDDGPAEQRLLSLVQVLADEEPGPAYEIMKYLAKPYGDSAYANYAVAVMAMSAEDMQEARDRAALAVELDPDWLKAKLLYARALLLNGSAEEAIDYTARIIGDDPDPDPDARLELALMMMSLDRNDDALSQVNQVILEQPGRADALRLMAIINFRQQNLDAAKADFEDLLATRRYTNDALYYLARIADFRGEVDAAIRFYAAVNGGGNAVISQRRAAALLAFERDDPDQAVELLDRFTADSPGYAIDMVLAKGQLLTSVERYEDALVYYDRYVEFRPDAEGGMLGRAELLLRMDRLDDSISQYRAAVEKFPESATSLNALGYTLADRTDQYVEAEKLIRKALEYQPDNPAIIDSMGWVLYRLGKNEEALVELEKAYAGFPDPEVAAHIVEVLHALGRQEEALERLVKAEERDPENSLLENVRERLFPDAE